MKEDWQGECERCRGRPLRNDQIDDVLKNGQAKSANDEFVWMYESMATKDACHSMYKTGATATAAGERLSMPTSMEKSVMYIYVCIDSNNRFESREKLLSQAQNSGF